MGLEDIVNILLKPFEEIAQAIYDLAYLEREDIVVDKDGNESIKKVYNPSQTGFKHYLDLLRVDYKTSKKMAYDLTVRPIDRYFKSDKKNESFVTRYVNNFTDFYKAHPILTTFGCLFAFCYI